MAKYVEVFKDGIITSVEQTTPNFLSIPPDPNNIDYANYLLWKEKGEKPDVRDETIVKTYEDLRQEEYQKRGVSIRNMIVALWEKTIENQSETADELQIIREQVKLDIPKPVLEEPVLEEPIEP
jgi:hypothetical protein